MSFLPFTAVNTNVVEVAGYTKVGGLHQKRHTVHSTSLYSCGLVLLSDLHVLHTEKTKSLHTGC